MPACSHASRAMEKPAISVSGGAWKRQIVDSPGSPVTRASSAPPPARQVSDTGAYGRVDQPDIEPLSHERTTYVPARAAGRGPATSRARATRGGRLPPPGARRGVLAPGRPAGGGGPAGG